MAEGFLLERMTWRQAQAAFARTSFVVVPLGSTEQHGPHLPLGTDFLVAKEMARRVGERANVIVTPTLPIGYAQYHAVFPGTLSVSEETLTNALIEICENLLRYGATHILFMNGHGGNMVALRRCGEWLRERCIPSAVACWWEMTHVVNPHWLALGHADYVETSAILALDESLPDMPAAKIAVNKPLTDKIALDDLRAARFKGAHLAVNLIMTDVTDDGGMMEYGMTGAKDYTIPPAAASKEIGEKIYEGLANYYAEFIEEFRRVKLPPIGSVGPLAKS
ncbi:MAG: creatininase family protein [Acidobacteriota bacterium]|jgi:creatinine amidohydrolase